MNARILAPLLAAFVALTSPSLAEQLRLPKTAPLPDAKSEPAGSLLPDNPAEVPIPEPKSEPAGNIPPEHPGDVPIPEPKLEPAGNIPPANRGDVPVPEPKPEHDQAETPRAPETPKAAETKPAPPPDPRSGTKPLTPMPMAETGCRQRLRDLGVVFEERPAEASADGCSLPYPVSVKALGDGASLAPPALMNCDTAEAAARFTKSVIAPAAKREFGTTLKSIDQASAYVCRPRNGGAKLSEHAFGNALDISAFKLSDGRTITVDEKTAMIRFRPDDGKVAKARTAAEKDTHARKEMVAPDPATAGVPNSPETRFMNTVRTAACGPFKTVLGPGSNADHATHFHFDLAPRKHGGTVCE